jgi:hypothetical protein
MVPVNKYDFQVSSRVKIRCEQLKTWPPILFAYGFTVAAYGGDPKDSNSKRYTKSDYMTVTRQ